jgi:large subunit ribosomal protein L1
MAPIDRCLASMARLSLAQATRPAVPTIPGFLAPSVVVQQTRHASVVRNKDKSKKKKKPVPKDFKRHRYEKTDFPQYSLCDALRVLRAYEVGKPPGVVKYELHIHMKTFRNGPTIKSSLRLPNPVQSEWQIAVICPEGSEIATAATAAGAKAVGEESLFEAIREGNIEFDRLLCHEKSEAALNKAQLGRILGPKGLMPSHKNKTITKDIIKAIKDSAGAADYREREGVVRMAVGQLGHSPEQLRANIESFVKQIKTQAANFSETTPKSVHEIILSSTNGPGLSLSGQFKNLDDEVTPAQLSGVM